MSLSFVLFQQLVNSCNDGARRMERTEQMYTIQKLLNFGKIKASFCLLLAWQFGLKCAGDRDSFWKCIFRSAGYNDVLILFIFSLLHRLCFEICCPVA